jgi:hypothetical protein
MDARLKKFLRADENEKDDKKCRQITMRLKLCFNPQGGKTPTH